MRKRLFVITALLAALALSVGAFAYPMVVGIHPLSAAHQAAPTNGTHPRGDDNSTGNETRDHENETSDNETGDQGNETENETGDHEGYEPPEANDTENDTGNDSGMDAAVQTLALTQPVVTSWMVGTPSWGGVLTLVRDVATVEWSLGTAAWGHLFG